MVFKFISFIIFLIFHINYSLSTITQRITGKVKIEEPTAERIKEITVSLENTDRIAYIDEDGNFEFNNVPIGQYTVHVNDNLYTYTPIFLDVTKKEVKAYDYSFKNGKGAKHKFPFDIYPVRRIQYTEARPPLLVSIIRSPYAIIISLTIAMFACMKMVPQEDWKQQSEEFNKQFKNMNMKSFF